MLNFLYKVYLKIPNFYSWGLIGKLLNKINSILFNKLINLLVEREYSKSNGLSHSKTVELDYNGEVIVSLTSFPARLDNLWITIESLFRQSFKPHKIVLWLVTEELNGITLPNNLNNLKMKGLEINYTNINLRPHNKYFHTMQKYPGATVVTVDDDIIYPNNMLENLIIMSRKHPKTICANLTSLITYNKSKILPYRNWIEYYKKDLQPNNKMVQLGVSGVLYPPKSLPDVCFNEKLIKRLAPTADDIWLNLMCYLNKTKIVTNVTFNKYFITVRSSQKTTLHSLNTSQGKNDEIFNDVINHFEIGLLNNFLKPDK
jgi:hypothetical protein